MNYIARAIAALALCMLAASAHAEFPDHPLRLVVPFPPGANNDATGRLIAKGLAAVLGQPVIVDNKAGAAGQLGADFVRTSRPDGYTLLLANSGALASVQASDPAAKLDPMKDFTAVGSISRVPMVLVVNPSLPVKSMAELIAYAKERPGKLTMASSGTGGAGHLTGELFQSISGTKFLHVPYKGNSQAMVDLLGGQVDLMFDQPSNTLSYLESGKLRGLGVGTLARSSVLPQLPTLNESGLSGFDASATTGLLFPAGTPKPIVDKVSQALIQVLRMPDTRRQLELLGGDVLEGSGDDFARLVHSETQKWTKVIRDAGVNVR